MWDGIGTKATLIFPEAFFSGFSKVWSHFPPSELPDSSSAACSFLLSWVFRMCLGTAVSLQGHPLGSCPRLWKPLVPSHSQPQSQSQRGTLEVRSLGCPRWEICPCLGTVAMFTNNTRKQENALSSWCRNWGQPLLWSWGCKCSPISPPACRV